jgi:uncharacterized protein
VNEVRAIDVHCHPSTSEYFESFGRFVPALRETFKVDLHPKTEEAMADDYRAAGVRGMMIAWESRADDGLASISNEFIASLTERYPDAFLPGWAVVDPWGGDVALRNLEHAITDLGLTGAKFHPQIQAFHPNDRRFYPIWDLLQSLGAPALFHTGTTGIGSGMDGGGGIKLGYGRPIPTLDDVAADFPNLTIVAAHPSWPWIDEQIALLLHKRNVYLDISGWRPSRIPEPLKREINNRLQDKVFFGSDYPVLMPGRLLDELEQEDFKPDVLEKVFRGNAARVFGIEAAS